MINVNRNLSVFDPDAFKMSIHVIGAGATGSKIVMELAKLGLEKINVWDFDRVEAHNLNNQFFALEDIGEFKVDALKEQVKRFTGTEIRVHNREVKDQVLTGIIFILTDTMSSRKEIFENCCYLNPSVPFVIETRMGIDQGRIYSFDNSDIDLVKKYQNTMYESIEVKEASACGATPSIGATSSLISSLAVWQFMKYAKKESVEFQTIIGVRPISLLSK